MKYWMIFYLVLASFQARAQSQIKWTSFADLSDSLRHQRRPLLIFIHTDWCKFCKMQENNTFTQEALVEALNSTFYCLKLNAEASQNISFLGRSYAAQSNDYHPLAIMLGKEDGELSFPTTVILSASWQIAARFTGFVDSETLLEVL